MVSKHPVTIHKQHALRRQARFVWGGMTGIPSIVVCMLMYIPLLMLSGEPINDSSRTLRYGIPYSLVFKLSATDF